MILSPAPLPWRVAMAGARILVVDRDSRVVEEVQPEIDRVRTQRVPGAARETAIERVNEADPSDANRHGRAVRLSPEGRNPPSNTAALKSPASADGRWRLG